MKKTLAFICIPFLLCCQNAVSMDEKISEKRVSISFESDKSNPRYYHLYCENIGDKKRSKGLLLKGADGPQVEIHLFPGRYNIYLYGLTPKGEKSTSLCSSALLKGAAIFDDRVISLSPLELTPVFSYHLDREKGVVTVVVEAGQTSALLRLSSLSLKQGSSRREALKFSYDKENGLYRASTTIKGGGASYLNLSYSLKGPKDQALLKEKGLSISTSSFKGLFLCNI